MSEQKMPEKGDRVKVLLEGKVTMLNVDGTFCVGDCTGTEYAWAFPRRIVTPRQPWDVLREAAGVLAHYNGKDGGDTGALLCRAADQIEAAAAPKPPTLLEAAVALLKAMSTRSETPDLMNALEQAVLRDIKREKAGA